MLNKISKDNSEIYSKGSSGKAVMILNGFATPLSDTDLVFNYFKKKNYTVARPRFHVTPRDGVTHSDCEPLGWFTLVRAWIKELEQEENEIYIVGTSFGCNLGFSLTVSNSKKIKAIAAIEAPVIFNFKFTLLSSVIQPLFMHLGVKEVKKSSLWYRGRKAKKRPEASEFTFVSVRLAGLIKDYINQRTKIELNQVKVPALIIQSLESDVLSKKNAEHIFKKIKSQVKEVSYIPLRNHDLTLLDETGKVIMLEGIYKFFEYI